MKKENLAYVLVCITAMIWATGAALSKLVLAEIDSLQFLMFVTLFAFAGMLAAVLVTRKAGIIRKYKPRDYLVFSYMGFIGMFFYLFLFYSSLAIMRAQETVAVNYLWPIMVVIFASVILKERPTIRKLSGILISFMGVIVVITGGNPLSIQLSSLEGTLMAMAGAALYGLFSVLSKKHNYDKLTSMMFYCLFAFIYAFASALIFSSVPAVSLSQLAVMSWVGAFVNGLGISLWLLALKYGDTAKIANIIYITPFMALVYIYFLVGEEILASSVIGLAGIIAGNLIQQTRKNSG